MDTVFGFLDSLGFSCRLQWKTYPWAADESLLEVIRGKIVIDGGDQLQWIPKSAAADTVVAEVATSTLQYPQPGPRSRDVVQMKPRIPPKTGCHAKYLCVPRLPRRRCRSRLDEVLFSTFSIKGMNSGSW